MSGLAMDINDIVVSEPNYDSQFQFITILHTEVGDLNENDEVFISSMMIDRNYKEDGSDYMEIDLFVKPGTYIYDIYPFADNLEITVIRLKQHRNGNTVITSEDRFKAVFLLEKNMNLPNTKYLPKTILNNQPYLVLTLQLVDRGALAIRNSAVQGSYSDLISEKNKDMTASSILKSALSVMAAKIELDNQPVISRIDIEETQNKDPIKAITIPTGTRALDLANFIQEKRGGLYTAGVNTYIQKYSTNLYSPPERVLFVYSLYDGEKFDRADNKIMFFIPEDNKMQLGEKSYLYRGNLLKILTTSSKGFTSTKGAVLRNKGEGFRTADANKMMDEPLDFTEEGPKFKKTQILTEVANKEQKDGITYVPYKGISGNHFVNTSEILSRSGEYINLTTNNLDPDYLYPGAACKLLFDLGNGMIGELNGVIHASTFRFEYGHFNPVGEATTTRHSLLSKAVITVYITNTQEGS